MMSSVVSSIFFFIVALGLLIAIHEFGHYWVARKLGVKVLRFSIGFGKPLWKTTRGADNTEYVVAAIPLGGYVRMLDEREGEVAPQELHRAFNRQSVRKRFAIVAAGPLFNFMLAIIAYWLVFLIGVTTVKPVVGTVAADSPAAQAGFANGDRIVAVGDEQTPGWQSVAMALLEKSLDEGSVPVKVTDAAGQPQTRMLRISSVQKKLERGNLLDTLGIEPARPLLPPRLGNLEAGGAAAQAGMQVGDLIVSADGTAMQDWDRWVEYVRAHPQQIIRTEVERAGDRLTLELRPARRASKEGDVGYIGAGVMVPENMGDDYTTLVRYSPLAAMGESVSKTWHMSALTLRMLWGMVAGEVSVSNISGPISIAQYAGYSAQGGVVSFLTFLAIVSISLGVLNLLPVPVLDGGHLLYYIIEGIKGSPVSDAVQAMGQRIGVTALLLLMAVAVYNDVVHLFK